MSLEAGMLIRFPANFLLSLIGGSQTSLTCPCLRSRKNTTQAPLRELRTSSPTPPAHLRKLASTRLKAPNVEWLRPTSTVMGLFENSRCEIAEVYLAPGDTLVLYRWNH